MKKMNRPKVCQHHLHAVSNVRSDATALFVRARQMSKECSQQDPANFADFGTDFRVAECRTGRPNEPFGKPTYPGLYAGAFA